MSKHSSVKAAWLFVRNAEPDESANDDTTPDCAKLPKKLVGDHRARARVVWSVRGRPRPSRPRRAEDTECFPDNLLAHRWVCSCPLSLFLFLSLTSSVLPQGHLGKLGLMQRDIYHFRASHANHVSFGNATLVSAYSQICLIDSRIMVRFGQWSQVFDNLVVLIVHTQ